MYMMDYNFDVLEKAISLIKQKYFIDESKAKEYATKAIEGLISHVGNPNDIYSLTRVVDIVVKSWIEDDMIK